MKDMNKLAKRLATVAVVGGLIAGANVADVKADIVDNTATKEIAVSVDSNDSGKVIDNNEIIIEEEVVERTENIVSETEQDTESTEISTENTETESNQDVKYPQLVGKAIVKVSSSLNIRQEESTDSEIIGKLQNGDSVTVISTDNIWTQIKSGTLQGYVRTKFLVFGDEAGEYAEDVCDKVATVNAQTLRVRSKKSTDSQVVTLVGQGEKYTVIEEYNKWVKIKVDEKTEGYVSKDYVTIKFVLTKGKTVEEIQVAEQEKQEAELKEAQAKLEKEKLEQEKANLEKASAEEEKKASTNSAASLDSLRKEVVNYALQFVGNPYVYGGTSLTNGADCSGFVMKVYEHFGYYLNRVSREQAYNGISVSLNELKPGDLLFYSGSNGVIGHVAMYIGNNKVVHASNEATGIKISNANYRTPCKVRRIIY